MVVPVYELLIYFDKNGAVSVVALSCRKEGGGDPGDFTPGRFRFYSTKGAFIILSHGVYISWLLILLSAHTE